MIFSLGVLHQEDEPLECLALKANGAYFQESQRAVENRDLTSIFFFLCAHKIPYVLGSRAEAIIWKKPGSDLPGDL